MEFNEFEISLSQGSRNPLEGHAFNRTTVSLLSLIRQTEFLLTALTTCFN